MTAKTIAQLEVATTLLGGELFEADQPSNPESVKVTVEQIVEAVDFLHVVHSTIRTGKDANGIFVTVTERRNNNVLFRVSTLSGGTSPTYTTRTVQHYDSAGTLIATHVYNLTYDGTDLAGEVRV